MDEIKDNQLLQTRLTLTTPLKLDTQYSMKHCEIDLCKNNRKDQCQDEMSACKCGMLV